MVYSLCQKIHHQCYSEAECTYKHIDHPLHCDIGTKPFNTSSISHASAMQGLVITSGMLSLPEANSQLF